mgnify:CR=1 FL=1
MGNLAAALQTTQCAICLTDDLDQELYPATFTSEDIAAEIFSARRMPDRVHYRIVVCKGCGLMRSSPVLTEETLKHLYAQSHFTYVDIAPWATATYLKYFKNAAGDAGKGVRILEIGCGNGDFLKGLVQDGYSNVHGIEPSAAAVSESAGVKGLIYQGVLTSGIYPEGHFDVIAGFQVFDHISTPNDFLKDCRSYLKAHGKLLLIMHDIGAPMARILGRHCPMVDIEHPFLYNRKTLRKLLTGQGFTVESVFSVANTYPCWYWAQLLPAPQGIKNRLVQWLKKSPLGQMAISLNAGNMGIVVTKN